MIRTDHVSTYRCDASSLEGVGDEVCPRRDRDGDEGEQITGEVAANLGSCVFDARDSDDDRQSLRPCAVGDQPGIDNANSAEAKTRQS